MSSPDADSLDALVGLGNPGPDYERTYHNVGFQVVDFLINRYEVAQDHSDDRGTLLRLQAAPIRYLGKPRRYMNRSGTVVLEWCERFDISPVNLLVVYDDFDLDVGRVRLRPSGSAGSHNGMKDVLDQLGTEAVPRLRIGIGPVPEGTPPREYVLRRMSDRDRAILIAVVRQVPELLRTIDADGMEAGMNRWNGVDFRDRD